MRETGLGRAEPMALRNTLGAMNPTLCGAGQIRARGCRARPYRVHGGTRDRGLGFRLGGGRRRRRRRATAAFSFLGPASALSGGRRNDGRDGEIAIGDHRFTFGGRRRADMRSNRQRRKPVMWIVMWWNGFDRADQFDFVPHDVSTPPRSAGEASC